MFQCTHFSKQLADFLTKAASSQVFSNLCNKLSILDFYAPSWGAVLNWIIIIGLFGYYPNSYLVSYIYLVSSLMKYNYYLLRVSISLHSLWVGWRTYKIKKHMHTTLWDICAAVTCWGIWREHNNRIFRWCTRSLDPTFSHIISDILFSTSLAS